MATRRASTGTVPSLTSSFTLTLATHATGDLLLAWVGGKYGATATIPAAPSGWSLVASTTGGTVTTGADAGDSFLALYARVAVSSSETNPVFNAGGTAPDSWWGIAESFTPAAGKEWDDRFAFSSMPKATGNDTTAASPLTASGTFGTQPNAIRGDTIACCGAIPTDLGTGASSPTLTFAAGASGGSAAVGTYVENALGADSAGISWDLVGFTGASTSTVTIAVTIAGASNNYGPVMAVWLRESTTKTGSDTLTATETSSTRYTAAGEIAVFSEAGAVVNLKSGAETAALTDASSLAVTFTRADTAALTDASSLLNTLSRADTLAFTEPTRVVYTGAGELLGFTESASVQLASASKSDNEPVTFSDDLDTTIADAGGGENLTWADPSTRVVYGKAGELLNILEGAAVEVTDTPKAGAETLAFSETQQIGRTGPPDSAAFSDDLDTTVADAGGGELLAFVEVSTRVVYQGQGEHWAMTDVGLVTTAPVGVSESMTLTDSRALLAQPVRDDPVAFQEGSAVAAALSRAEEVFTFDDQSVLATTVIADEPVTLTETATVAAQLSAADQLGFTDAASNPQVTATANEAVTFIEQTQLDTGATKSDVDALVFSEQLLQLTAVLSAADTAALTEGRTVSVAVSAADTLTFSEAGNVGTQSNQAAEQAILTELAQIVATVLRSDQLSLDDSTRHVQVPGPPVYGPGRTRGGGRTATLAATGPGRTSQ